MRFGDTGTIPPSCGESGRFWRRRLPVGYRGSMATGRDWGAAGRGAAERKHRLEAAVERSNGPSRRRSTGRSFFWRPRRARTAGGVGYSRSVYRCLTSTTCSQEWVPIAPVWDAAFTTRFHGGQHAPVCWEDVGSATVLRQSRCGPSRRTDRGPAPCMRTERSIAAFQMQETIKPGDRRVFQPPEGRRFEFASDSFSTG